MFKIVALAYILGVGQPTSEPVSFTLDVSFAGLDKCQEHLQSKTFAEQRAKLLQILTTAAGGVAVSITASCSEDDRV